MFNLLINNRNIFSKELELEPLINRAVGSVYWQSNMRNYSYIEFYILDSANISNRRFLGSFINEQGVCSTKFDMEIYRELIENFIIKYDIL